MAKPSGEHEGSVTISGETSALFADLLPNQEYIVSIEASILSEGTTCNIGRYQQSVILQSDSDDPLLDDDGKHRGLLSVLYQCMCSVNLVVTIHISYPAGFRISLQLWIIIAVVCALGIVGIVITLLLIIAFCLKRRCRKSTLSKL